MRIIIVIVLLIISVQVNAEQRLEVMVKENNFFGQYNHQLYIQNGNLVFIDEHFQKNNRLPTNSLPKILTEKLTLDEERALILGIKELGVENWGEEYPESREGYSQICDGLSYIIYIKAKDLDVITVGACDTPNNYRKVINLLGVK
jgi:hypothetical protein